MIVVGLEDGSFAVIDECQVGRRDYFHCESVVHLEEHLVALRERGMNPRHTPPLSVNLEELGLA